MRMYDPSSGSIEIDGEDIRSMDLENLRSRIGYVPQDVFLFSDSIQNNVSFGQTQSTLDEVKKYTEYAAIHTDIMSLPHQYETRVGERGVTLSGGQKQRISIARALIKDPDIVLLDDCLSAVDTNTEQHILSYLNTALSQKTTILITHRVNSLMDLDKIIVLEKGKIVEEGLHDDLIELKGYYYDLLQHQLKETQA